MAVPVAHADGVPALEHTKPPKAAAPAEADKPGQAHNPLAFELDHYTLIPPSPNQSSDPESRPSADPTIVPFSGWHFFGSDGELQPWRKRTVTYQRNSGGQDSFNAKKGFVLATRWRYPKAAKAKSLWLIPTGNSRNAFAGGGSRSEDSRDKTFAFNLRRFEINDLETLPDHIPLSLEYLQGDWEVVAKAGFDTKLPVGNKHFTIEYVGAPRPDSPVVKSLERDRAVFDKEYQQDFYQKPFDIELHTTKRYPRDQWRYQIVWYDKQNKQRIMGGYGTSSGKDSYKLLRMDAKKIDRFEIQRLPKFKQKIKPFDLSPVIEKVLPDEAKQRRIKLTGDHRFSEPITLELASYRAGAKCLVDLDRAKLIALPDPVPTGDDLEKFFEEQGIDLFIYYAPDHKRTKVRIQTLACPAYSLERAFWKQKPSACIRHIRAEDDWNENNFGLSQKDWYPMLATTSDGGMALFREVRVIADPAKNEAKVTLEIRKLLAPAK